MVFKTHPLQDIASCIAWDNLVELEKMKIHVKIVEVVLNYKKNYCCVIAYRFNIEGLLELNAEAPIFVQLNEPVAHTSVVVAPVALPQAVFIVRVRHFRPMFIIQILN